jgi:hypothetical protein
MRKNTLLVLPCQPFSVRTCCLVLQLLVREADGVLAVGTAVRRERVMSTYDPPNVDWYWIDEYCVAIE